MKIKALLERVHSRWDASVTADLAMIPSLQLLFILTNLKPTTKVSELRVDMKYTLLGQRCAMAHDRLAEHSGSNWRRVAEPVLGAGVNISEESVHRVALECGWQVTWMTDEVTTYAQRRSAARQSADTQGRLSFTRGPAPVAPTGVPSQGGVPTSVVSDPAPVAQEMRYRKAECQTLSFLILCLRLLLFPIQAKQPMAGRLGLGNKAECRFNSRLSPLVLLLVLIQARQPMMAARLQEGNKAECRVLCKKAECQLIGLLLMP